ncbi:MAG TPA: oligosaccharide flippase family protein [Solirubrobacteraceae bacterium]
MVVAEGVARLLSFVFYIAAARALAPADFGAVRYALALGLVAAGGTAVVATALGRELGASRARPEAVGAVAGSGVVAAAALLLLTLAATCVAAAAGVLGRAPIAGLLVAITGLSTLQIYYAAAGALGHVRRMVTAYAGSSLLQLAGLLALAAAGSVDATTVLVLFGASNVALCVLLEVVDPMWSWRALTPTREATRVLWRLSQPLAASSIGFLLWSCVDQIWVEATFPEEDAGIYGAAKNLSMLFMVLPAAVRAVSMPRVAHLRAASDDAGARALIARLLTVAVGLAAAVTVGAAVAGPTVIKAAYGDAYAAGDTAFLALAVSMALFAVFATLVNAAVGWGRPGVTSVAYVVAAGIQLALLLAAGDDPSLAYAGWASAIAIAAALAVIAVLLRRAVRGDGGADA